MLLLVVVVVVSRTCDGKYFHDQLAARRDQAGRPGQAQSGWRNYLAVGKYWCKLAGWLAGWLTTIFPEIANIIKQWPADLPTTAQ